MTVEQVETAFQKALEMTKEARASLPVECVSASLLESLLAYFIEAQKEPVPPSQLKEAA